MVFLLVARTHSACTRVGWVSGRRRKPPHELLNVCCAGTQSKYSRQKQRRQHKSINNATIDVRQHHLPTLVASPTEKHKRNDAKRVIRQKCEWWDRKQLEFFCSNNLRLLLLVRFFFHVHFVFLISFWYVSGIFHCIISMGVSAFEEYQSTDAT